MNGVYVWEWEDAERDGEFFRVVYSVEWTSNREETSIEKVVVDAVFQAASRDAEDDNERELQMYDLLGAHWIGRFHREIESTERFHESLLQHIEREEEAAKGDYEEDDGR